MNEDDLRNLDPSELTPQKILEFMNTNESFFVGNPYEIVKKINNFNRTTNNPLSAINDEIMDLCKHKYPFYGINVDIKPQSKVNKTKPKKTEVNETFELWYSEYPRKEAKQDAIKAWNKLQKSMPELSVMVDKLKKQIAVHNWTKENIKYIPLPASYLNGKRWEDVIEEQVMQEGKPAEIAEKMVTGRLNKFYKEICLEEQAFIKENSIRKGNFNRS